MYFFYKQDLFPFSRARPRETIEETTGTLLGVISRARGSRYVRCSTALICVSQERRRVPRPRGGFRSLVRLAHAMQTVWSSRLSRRILASSIESSVFTRKLVSQRWVRRKRGGENRRVPIGGKLAPGDLTLVRSRFQARNQSPPSAERRCEIGRLSRREREPVPSVRRRAGDRCRGEVKCPPIWL